MPRNRVRRSSGWLVLIALAGCDSATVGNRTQRSGEVKVAIDDPLTANNAQAPEGVGAPMAWRVVTGAAFYGADGQPPAFALRCDAMNNSVILERAGAGTALTLSVSGVSTSVAAGDAGEDRVQGRVALSDGVLDAMARSQSEIIVGGGADPVTVPGGIAVRRVVDACRNPPAPEPPAEEVPDAENAVPPVLPTPPN